MEPITIIDMSERTVSVRLALENVVMTGRARRRIPSRWPREWDSCAVYAAGRFAKRITNLA